MFRGGHIVNKLEIFHFVVFFIESFRENWSIIQITGNCGGRKRKVSADEENSAVKRVLKPPEGAFQAHYSKKELQRFFLKNLKDYADFGQK